ncbi:MAG: Transcriptional regulator, XRE family [Parcubacteria group bacterium GW2011_GWA1_44_13]|uniref:Transcriptional regulator, XRE family n=1 Tax=Candidatus Nomurabacteria bacterium GW2011_GWB1_44_12 TaxID=1618748 RepID=A0A837ID14_9BACT|nr:MAG: Transcriptional regulator, XRE family [Candidatus Nomurabacteria bacterium GW2011_GWD1_44_10]KKT36771.1 MAG: Transcriptional regulator, XRE family [Candidatus Nomurabacteria bacterium GW2011_GWB1_44_12]KKT37455.1 MAG: Transcriptional regulator, XRE family [Parcubacteria group bacterium GW2011_GWA1_44_13]KKT60544.1 MAG: Transcriptional regulator, XRE family [Parcubacteria group bacterium GW2011_GWC1_44_26]HBB43873.1 XRE family transcriptional regulator [Candidatus Yonathbacteria bacteriu
MAQKLPKTITFEQILKKQLKSPEFREAYNEELFRLKIASEIKSLRLQKKLTQETFAKKAQMPQSVVARIESGKHSISLGTLNRVALALGKRVQLV